MATRGRWGVTREENGELSLFLEWPWYWRYPAAVLLFAVALRVGTFIAEPDDWLRWAIIGAGTIGALVITYELGCLVIVLAGLGGSYIGLTTLFPALKVDWSLQSVGFGAALVYAYWLIGKYRDRLWKAEQAIQKAERDITALQTRLLNYRRNDHL